jgi:catalase
MDMWLISDRAIPHSFRMMQGFGVNAYVLVNEKDVTHLCQIPYDAGAWRALFSVRRSAETAGLDPDFHGRDLYSSIESGMYPKWKFGIQALKSEGENDFHILDATNVWPQDIAPVFYFGELELNRNVEE